MKHNISLRNLKKRLIHEYVRLHNENFQKILRSKVLKTEKTVCRQRKPYAQEHMVNPPPNHPPTSSKG